MSSRNASFIQLLAAVVAFIGFRLACQVGQEGVVIQSDGYAVSGGLLILLGGLIFGYVSARSTTQKKK